MINEEKEFTDYQRYCEYIWNHLNQKLSSIDKQISANQVYSIFNKILELNEITETEIDKVIRKELKNDLFH